MPLDLPRGATCFVDASIFVYQFVGLGHISARCRAFLERAVRREIDLVSTPVCLADAVHRVMCVEAQERFRLTTGAVAWQQRHPERIHEPSAFRDAARQLDSLPFRLLPTDGRTIVDGADLSAQRGLLMNDATIVTLMRRYGLGHLVTNDDDSDRVPVLAV